MSMSILPIVRPRLFLCEIEPNNRKLQDEINEAHAGGPLVTKFSNASCISLTSSSSGGVP